MSDNNIGPGKVLDDFQSLIFGSDNTTTKSQTPAPNQESPSEQSRETHYQKNNPQQQELVNPPQRPVQKIFRK